MLEYFDNYNQKYYNNKLIASSYWVYNSEGINIGQGADSFFIKDNSLKDFFSYYNIIKEYDFINHHDDFYISYYLYLKQIEIKYIEPPKNCLIYDKHVSSDINSLLNEQNNSCRYNLNIKIKKLLNKLKDNGKFNNFINNLVSDY